MAKQKEEGQDYRFVGRNHTIGFGKDARKLEFGEIVKLTEQQARNWAGKFRKVGAEVGDASQIRAEGTVESHRLISEAQAEAAQRIEQARAQAAEILRAADSQVDEILTKAAKVAAENVAQAEKK